MTADDAMANPDQDPVVDIRHQENQCRVVLIWPRDSVGGEETNKKKE